MRSGGRILVVEDDPQTQRLLRKQLASKGFEVTIATNGNDALVKLEEKRPSVILCDLNAYGRLSFTRAMQACSETRAIPILFLSHSEQRAERRSQRPPPRMCRPVCIGRYCRS